MIRTCLRTRAHVLQRIHGLDVASDLVRITQSWSMLVLSCWVGAKRRRGVVHGKSGSGFVRNSSGIASCGRGDGVDGASDRTRRSNRCSLVRPHRQGSSGNSLESRNILDLYRAAFSLAFLAALLRRRSSALSAKVGLWLLLFLVAIFDRSH
jgi:hypothetical protein